MDFEFQELIEIPLKIRVKGFLPGRSAPACSNPSSPRYSDDGDVAEYRTADFYIDYAGPNVKLPDNIVDAIYEALTTQHGNLLDDIIIEKGEEIVDERRGYGER